MKYDAKMLIKLSLIFFGLLFLVCIWLGRRGQGKQMPEGETIAVQDVRILLDVLDIEVPEEIWEDGRKAEAEEKEQKDIRDSEGADRQESVTGLTYGQYMAICRAVDEGQIGLPDFSGRYEADYEMLKSDWYEAYRRLLACYDRESSVWETTVFLLGIDREVKEAYTENVSMESPYHYESVQFEQNILREMRAYVKGDRLLTVIEVLPGEYTLENVWVTEAEEGMLKCFYHNTAFESGAVQSAEREQIADLTFRDGTVIKAREKKEKVHGKLLWVSEDEMEIEGSGVYPVSGNVEVYKLYGSLKTLERADLRIGYSDTDYVIEKGEVCACLVSEREAADRIRVLLKNTAGNSNYYDEAELTIDGETVRIQASDLDVGERRSYRCDALTDKISVRIAGIDKADNAYRGTIECYRNGEGMVLINELPLEEYLYAVVPSEMPASYPLEALKAQAVCARTYAYRYILHAALPELGAHLDDTTSFQVYHNIAENAQTTTAVKETDGVLLTCEGEPAQNYYYSTSCGVGTDASIWKTGGGQDISYIRPMRMNTQEYAAAQAESMEKEEGAEKENITGEIPEESKERQDVIEKMQEPEQLWQEEGAVVDDLREEARFREFITSTDETDLEYEEPWYRWTYMVETLDRETMLARLQERFAANPAAVLTKAEGDYFVSEPVERLSPVLELSIVKRGPGGVADELLIETEKETYKVLAEYNIRSVLCDKKSRAVKQDGTSTVPGSLLPSGFFVIEAGKSGENVVGYTLIGGGYGHGAGMSQNGARALGEGGISYRGILEFFFRGCGLEQIAAD
mgnify:CR=1 FL=1